MMFFGIKKSSGKTRCALTRLCRAAFLHDFFYVLDYCFERRSRSIVSGYSLFFEKWLILFRDYSPPHKQNFTGSSLPDELSDLRKSCQMCTVQKAHRDHIHVLVYGHLGDLFLRGAETRVDYLHARAPERPA